MTDMNHQAVISSGTIHALLVTHLGVIKEVTHSSQLLMRLRPHAQEHQVDL